MQKSADTSVPIHPLLANRWSPYSFDSTKPVSETARTALLEAARWAPSCFGEQPWYFVICDKTTHPDAWEKTHASLAEGNQVWAEKAPLLIVVCASTHFSLNGKANQHHAYDSGAAALSLVLEAENQGLRAHQMAGFDANVARVAFHIPDHYSCLAVIAIGYQAAAEQLPESLRERDKTTRTRQSLTDHFFLGTWGQNETIA